MHKVISFLMFLMVSFYFSSIKAQTTAVFDNIIVYENENFQGRSQSMALGNWRLIEPTSLNDAISSIKIPAGLVVIVYEHANDAGGFGKSVDLMENHSTLSDIGFNDKISYISVFKSTSNNTFWKRNTKINGSFIAGHWERVRATGIPVQINSVVSPEYPEKLMPKKTILTSHGNSTEIQQLSLDYNATLWDKAKTDQMGIIGSDYGGKEIIGQHAFERATGNGVLNSFGADRFNFYYPQHRLHDPASKSSSYYKHTIAGILKKAATYHGEDGFFPDGDLNIEVTPSSNYQYLISEGEKPEITFLTKQGQDFGGTDPCPDVFTTVEGEVELKTSQHHLENMLQTCGGSTICLYGPWIYDDGHCQHPEIHPAEQIWFSKPFGNGNIYYCALICDASERFWWRSQMDVDAVLNSGPRKQKPWASPPIIGKFAIAFEAEIGSKKQQFSLQEISSLNQSINANSHETYNLMYNGQILISFIPNGKSFKVTYENIGLVTGTNKIRGFIVLEATVGKLTPLTSKKDPMEVNELEERLKFKKQAGHLIFTISSSQL
ncbi:MAG: hypothetical protein JNM95_06485 [Chitinophagaceae bacterium]|nr:hypothetical protein [Chitinophagaceae bacterium]